ncbi:hypothetical protein [Escherichia coli]|uniref:hypothetical protein n=1 Tax=Escherichia coli TaxID=562 RepID=UPI0038B35BB9
MISKVDITPKTDAVVWVGYSQPKGDGVFGVAKNENGDTFGIWFNSTLDGDFGGINAVVGDTAISNKTVTGGTTVKNTLVYAYSGGALEHAGTYTYGIDAGYWNM